MGEWRSLFVWRFSGSWPSASEIGGPEDQALIQRAILGGIGVPLDTADILEFERSDYERLLTLLFTVSVFAWAVIDDLYLVPDHAKQFAKVSHHDKVLVTLRDPSESGAWTEFFGSREIPVTTWTPPQAR